MSEASKLKQICSCALSNGIPYRSFFTALVVGTILNAINQGDELIGAASVSWFKIISTYLVPYGVYTYGAVSMQLRRGNLGRESGNAVCR
jgi:hypothetical protein